MTNKEYLENLTVEELAVSPFFTTCPYGELYIQIMKNKGENICAKQEVLDKLDSSAWADFVFSGKAKETCNACKLKWLLKEKE